MATPDDDVTRSVPWDPADRSRTRRAAAAGGVGTLIEYYDFSLYGYLAVIVAPLFFPSDDPVVSLLSALAVFGTAYLIRPLGGFLFGHVGDRFGRRTALLATLVAMGAGSVALGLLPTYAQAGVWATVLLVAVRLLQGLSAGGEVGGAATFVSESTPARLKSTYGAVTPLGATGGFALAAAVAGTVSALTTEEQMAAWGWRVPFLLALPLTAFCLWIRTRVEETMTDDGEDGEAGRRTPPFAAVFRDEPIALAQASVISLAVNGTAYIGLTYLSIHLIARLGYPATPVYWVATVVIGVSAVGMLLGGVLGDRIGPARLMLLGFGGFILLAYPAFAVMGQGLVVAAVAYFVLQLNTIGTQVGAYTLLPQLFGSAVRYTGVATGWNIGVVISGGTAPFLAVWLIETTGNEQSPAWFVIVCAVLGLTAVLTVRRLVPTTAH